MSVDSDDQSALGHAIVGFSHAGEFPDNDVSSIKLQDEQLPVALKVLGDAKSELETEIRKISRESAPEVDNWIQNAKSLQNDIKKSRALASQIVREAEHGDDLTSRARDAKLHIDFLEKELGYNGQLRTALIRIKTINEKLDLAVKEGDENRILPALHLLEQALDVLDEIPDSQKTRPIRLLASRATGIQEALQQSFDLNWKNLVDVDESAGTVTIRQSIAGNVDMSSAMIIIKSFQEFDHRITELCHHLQQIIIKPRLELSGGEFTTVHVGEVTSRDQQDVHYTLRISKGEGDPTIKSLFADLSTIVDFLSNHLPTEFAQELSRCLMRQTSEQLRETWLDSAVPSSLDNMESFQKALAIVQIFVNKLKGLQWGGTEDLEEWMQNASKVWLTKRRETSLEWIRNRLSLGVGVSRKVERIEKQTISRSEINQLGANGNEWDSAWSDDEEPIQKAKAEPEPTNGEGPETTKTGEEDDDAAEAWGWGDEEDGTAEHPIDISDTASPFAKPAVPATKEITLTEKYVISSMPENVLKMITEMIEDSTTLTSEEHSSNPVSPAAAGLFALPTLVLAMYRAVSPHYYGMTPGGNMFLYNDSLWLADKLRDYSVEWNARENLPSRAYGRVKLESEIMVLEKFGRRAYGNEMSTQRTIITDLLGGAQNFLQQDGHSNGDEEASIDAVVALIRNTSTQWEKILSKSAWAQSVGSLLSTVSGRVIRDIQELPSLSADDAFRIASLIAKIVKLDDLYLPENHEQHQVPVTAQYVPEWLKLQYLSEVLQSDLKDVKFLWMDSDLSLYYTAQEAIELVKLSFADNERTREVISTIRNNRHPREG